MPDRVIGPLRDFRTTLHEGLHRLPSAAEAVSSGDNASALPALDAALEYLQGTLLPHCRSEKFTLFPAVEGVVGSIGTTQVMVAQHESIAAMVADLASVVIAARDGEIARYSRYLLPLLYGLYAAARVHLESEDDVYLSLLDEHLSESQVGVLVENLGRVAGGNAAPGDAPA